MLDPNEVAPNAKSLSQPRMKLDRSHSALGYCRRETWLGGRLDDDLPKAPNNSTSIFTMHSHQAGASRVLECMAQVLVLAQKSIFHLLGQYLCGLIVLFSHATWILWLLLGLKFQLHPNNLASLQNHAGKR